MTASSKLLRRLGLPTLFLLLATFAHAQVAPVPTPLVVQDVVCAGNAHTSCDFIRDHLYLHAGDALDEDEIRNAELRMTALRTFESVKIHLEKGAQRGAAIVVIEVTEAEPISTESLFGASSRRDSTRAVFAGRVAHQNLFGEGKIADLSVLAVVPVRGDSRVEAYNLTARYIDPQLFGSSRWFGIAGVGASRVHQENVYGNYSSLDTSQLDVRVGRRIADFSYLTIGLRYRPDLDWTWGRWESDGAFRTMDAHPHPVRPNIAYGWSTEDDLYFPTHGSTLHVSAGDDGIPIQFRKTWSAFGGWGTLKLGGDPRPEYRGTFSESELLALTYARTVAVGDDIKRGRWYVEPGIGFVGYAPGGRSVYEYGLKAGFRADTRLFGLVDFYVLGRKDTIR